MRSWGEVVTKHAAAICMILILFALLISPASAANYIITGNPQWGEQVIEGEVQTFTADTSPYNMSISQIEWDYPLNTNINFTLWYGSGKTVAGYIYYYDQGLFYSYTDIGLGNQNYAYTYGDLYRGRATLSNYARDEDQDPVQFGLLLHDSNFGSWNPLSSNSQAVFYPLNDTANNLIYKFHFIANRPVTIKYWAEDTDELKEASSKTTLERLYEAIGKFTSILGKVWEFFGSMFFWAKFILVDNVVLTVANIIMGGLAYAAMTSNSIWQFWSKFIRIIISLVNFAVNLFHSLVSIVTNIVSALKPFG